jgi:hypothetical protein
VNRFAPFFLFLIAVLLDGCAQVPMAKLDVDGINRELDNYVCGASDDRCQKDSVEQAEHKQCVALFDNPKDPRDPQKARARQLRAHLVVAVLARYGAARLVSYSDDPESDATRLLGRIEAAEIALAKARKLTDDAGAQRYFYEPARVDALIAIVDLAEAATRPTRVGLMRLAVLSTPGERLAAGPEILKNALKDKLYLNAYRDSLLELIQWVGSDAQKFNQAWKAVDQHLELACRNLAETAKTEQHCIPKLEQVAVP